MDTYKPPVLLIGAPQDYFQEQFNIEGVNYLCCSGQIRNILKNQFQVAVLFEQKIKEEESIILKEFIEQGGNLLMINPTNTICRFFNFEIKGHLKTGYLSFKVNNLHRSFCPIMYPISLKSGNKHESICSLLDESKKPTGYDSIFKINSGKGNIGVVAFDVFETLYQITHGTDITYKNSSSPILRVDDGRMINKNTMNIPVADIIRYVIINLILNYINYPISRLWYFPDGCKSALCVTHDSDNASSKDILEINKIDKKLKIRTTTFMSIFNGGLKSWRNFFDNYGLDLQFHPVQLYKYHPGKLINVIQRKIGSTNVFLKCQYLFFVFQKFLFDVLSQKNTKGIRFHGLQWNKLTDQPIWMSSIQTGFDSTLGSNHYHGYPYGSGLPYFLRHPKTYKNLDVLEFPMHMMDSAFVKKYGYKNWMENYFKAAKQFLNNSANLYFSLVVINLHHFVLLDRLENIKSYTEEDNVYRQGIFKAKVLDSYSELVNYSKQLNIKIESMSYFNDFWRKRKKVNITQYCWDHIKKQLNYKIVINDNNYVYSQILPFRFKKLNLNEIYLNEKKIDFEKIIIYNETYAFFQIEKGIASHNLSAFFV